MKYNAFSILFISFLILSCTGQLPKTSEHETANNGITIKSELNYEEEKIIHHITSLLAVVDEAAFLAESKIIYLDLGIWKNKKIAATNVFQKFLDRVQNQLMLLPYQKRWSKELKEHFDRFCSDQLEDCWGLGTLKISASSIQILLDLAKNETDVSKKYKFILLAFEIQNENLPKDQLHLLLSDYQSYQNKLIQSSQIPLLQKLDRMLSMFLEAPKATTNLIDHNSFLERQQWVTQNFPHILVALKYSPLAVDNHVADDYFFAVDNIFNGKWTSQKIGHFFSTANKQKIIEIGQTYLQFEVIFLAAKSQQELKILASKMEKMDSDRIFKEAKSLLEKTSADARALPANAKRLSQIFEDYGPKDLGVINFHKYVGNIERTLKILLSFPNTLAIIDIALRNGASKHTELEISKFDVSEDLKVRSIIAETFEGTLLPLLDYTSDFEPLNVFELAEAIELSARIGLFESIGTTLDEALSRFFDIYTSEDQLKLHSTQLDLDRKFKSTDWLLLQQRCHFTAGDAMSDRNTERREGAESMMLAETAKSPTLGNSAWRLGHVGTPHLNREGYSLNFQSNFIPNYDMLEELELLRSGLLIRIVWFENLIQDLEQFGISFPNLHNHLTRIKAEVTQFVTDFIYRLNESENCYFTLIKQEREVIANLILYEHKYWQWRHSQPKSQDEVSERIKSFLPPGLAYRTQANSQTLTFYPFDFLLRTKVYLKYGIASLNLKPLAPHLHIDLHPSLANSDLYKKDSMTQVSLAQTSDEFAKSAVRALGLIKDETSIVHWFRTSYIQIANFPVYYEAIAVLYRLGPLLESQLGIKNQFSIERLLGTPSKVFSFLNLSIKEQEALKIIGVQSRYSLTDLKPSEIFFHENGELVPTYDFFLFGLAKDFMGPWGAVLTAKDVQEGIRPLRPEHLFSIKSLGENLYYFKKQRVVPFFDSALTTPNSMAKRFTTLIQSDLAVQSNFVNAVRSLTSKAASNSTFQSAPQFTSKLQFYLSIENLSTQEPYSESAISNLESIQESFHQKTGRLFQSGG